MIIFIDNIDNKVSETTVKEMFSEYGAVVYVKIIRAVENSHAYIAMNDSDQAEIAIKKLHNMKLSGKKIIVRPAQMRGQERRNGNAETDKKPAERRTNGDRRIPTKDKK